MPNAKPPRPKKKLTKKSEEAFSASEITENKSKLSNKDLTQRTER